jgi:hypothetical protein
LPLHSIVFAVGAALAGAGVAAVVAAFALPPAAGNDLRGALAVGGFAGIIFGGVGALWARTRTRIAAAERSGGDVQQAAQGDPRWRGGALAALGVILVAVMVAVGAATVPQLVHPGRRIEGTRFTGSGQDALLILAVYAGVAAIGVAAIVYGVWMMRAGRQDKRVIAVAAALLALLLAVVAAL